MKFALGVSALVFVVIASSVTSQSFSVTLDKDKDELNQGEGSFPEIFLKKVSAMATSSPQTGGTSSLNNLANSPLLLPTIMGRFMKEMGSLFKALPINIQCHQLLKVRNATSCSSLTLQNWTSVNVSTCSQNEEQQEPSKACTDDATFKVFQQQMGRMFESLSQPFKCNIVNLVAQMYSSQSHVQIPVNKVEGAIQDLFYFVDLQGGCSRASPEALFPPAQMVNLTVKLNRNMTKNTWLRNFETKGPQLYKLYLEYQPHKNRHLSGTHLATTLPPEVSPCQIYIRNVSQGLQQFSFLFGLKVKKKGQFRAIKSVHKIVKSLKTAEPNKLEALLDAKVLQVNITNHGIVLGPPGSNSWTVAEITQAKNLFPKKMIGYFKQVSHMERCFILFQISSSLGRNPAEMEKFYHALKYVIRRRSCFQPGRGKNEPSPFPDMDDLNPERFTEARHPVTNLLATSMSFTKVTNQNKQPIGGNSEDEVSSLEYALFILLGLLCLATLAFTINYGLYTFRRSSTRTTQYRPNGMLPLQVVREDKREMVHCVHIRHSNHSMAKHEELPPLAIAKHSLKSNNPGVACIAAEQGKKRGTTTCGSDSGYSQSPEGSVATQSSDVIREFHSNMVHSLNSGDEQLKTELGSKAESSEVDVSQHVEASPDSESKPKSEVLSLHSSSVSVHSPSQDSELTCTQSPATLSQESAYEILHVMIDHGTSIKEIQV